MNKLYSEIAKLVIARNNCQEKYDKTPGNGESTQHWSKMLTMHRTTIKNLVKEFMPSGSGWDNGTKLEFDASNANKLVFYGSFHHMNDGGYYDGYTDHSIIVTPSLAFGFNIRITGRNRNDIKEYLHDLFNNALDTDISEYLELERCKMRAEKHIQFFIDNAGFSYDPLKETAEQGKQRCAKELAIAEQFAELQNWKFVWEADDNADASFVDTWEDKEAIAKWNAEEHFAYSCTLKDASGNVLASLHGIFDPTDSYRRVVQAELAEEAMDNAKG